MMEDSLPADIASRIPYTLSSDALGEAPDYLSIGGVIGFVVDLIITIGSVLYNLAANLVQLGISLFCTLANAVTAAIDAIVDAFIALVTCVTVNAIGHKDA